MFGDLFRKFGSKPDTKKHPMDQEIELANWSAVENLVSVGGKKMLERWIEIVDKGLDPTKEDGFLQLSYLYIEYDKYPKMDPVTKSIFLKYARRKLTTL